MQDDQSSYREEVLTQEIFSSMNNETKLTGKESTNLNFIPNFNNQEDHEFDLERFYEERQNKIEEVLQKKSEKDGKINRKKNNEEVMKSSGIDSMKKSYNQSMIKSQIQSPSSKFNQSYDSEIKKSSINKNPRKKSNLLDKSLNAKEYNSERKKDRTSIIRNQSNEDKKRTSIINKNKVILKIKDNQIIQIEDMKSHSKSRITIDSHTTKSSNTFRKNFSVKNNLVISERHKKEEAPQFVINLTRQNNEKSNKNIVLIKDKEESVKKNLEIKTEYKEVEIQDLQLKNQEIDQKIHNIRNSLKNLEIQNNYTKLQTSISDLKKEVITTNATTDKLLTQYESLNSNKPILENKRKNSSNYQSKMRPSLILQSESRKSIEEENKSKMEEDDRNENINMRKFSDNSEDKNTVQGLEGDEKRKIISLNSNLYKSPAHLSSNKYTQNDVNTILNRRKQSNNNNNLIPRDPSGDFYLKNLNWRKKIEEKTSETKKLLDTVEANKLKNPQISENSRKITDKNENFKNMSIYERNKEWKNESLKNILEEKIINENSKDFDECFFKPQTNEKLSVDEIKKIREDNCYVYKKNIEWLKKVAESRKEFMKERDNKLKSDSQSFKNSNVFKTSKSSRKQTSISKEKPQSLDENKVLILEEIRKLQGLNKKGDLTNVIDEIQKLVFSLDDVIKENKVFVKNLAENIEIENESKLNSNVINNKIDNHQVSKTFKNEGEDIEKLNYEKIFDKFDTENRKNEIFSEKLREKTDFINNSESVNRLATENNNEEID